MYDRIVDHYERNPDNALFAVAYHKIKDGDYSEPTATLLNERYFPADRLPTSKDRCTEYLWQRENDDDWESCKDKETHSGTDFLFATHLIEEYTNGW